MDLIEQWAEIVAMILAAILLFCVVITAGFYAWKYLMWLFQ